MYRSLNNVFSVLKEPGAAGLPVPIHLRNAPTKLMKSLDYGAEYSKFFIIDIYLDVFKSSLGFILVLDLVLLSALMNT